MDAHHTANGSQTASATNPAIDHLTEAIEAGADWPTALLGAMALWTIPEETFKGRRYIYLIGGEAFDLQLLADRLCQCVEGVVAPDEKEELLFTGRFPSYFDRSKIKDLLGVDKYRGHLNYYYGVTVEEALQLSAELEAEKRSASNGIQFKNDYTEDAFARVYRRSKDELLAMFWAEQGLDRNDRLSVSESKEFTYWLFKYRLEHSDKARMASDTRKGLQQLRSMKRTQRADVSLSAS